MCTTAHSNKKKNKKKQQQDNVYVTGDQSWTQWMLMTIEELFDPRINTDFKQKPDVRQFFVFWTALIVSGFTSRQPDFISEVPEKGQISD